MNRILPTTPRSAASRPPGSWAPLAWWALTLAAGCGGFGDGDSPGPDDDSAATGDDSGGDDDMGDDDMGDDDTTANPDDDASPDDDTTATGDDDTADDDSTPGIDEVEPPLGGASGGSSGSTCPSGCEESGGGVDYRIIVPSSYDSGHPAPLLVVFSGTEGGGLMTSNLRQVAAYCGIGDAVIAVLDGIDYVGDGAAGAVVLDDVRARWNIDNDQTWLLSESAGTSAGLDLGLDLRQSWFAAYWANDVNDADTPTRDAETLGFSPWGNAGPGGDFVDANAIVAGMEEAGYRLPADAPYSGAGASSHGSEEQFLAAVSFFAGKSRL